MFHFCNTVFRCSFPLSVGGRDSWLLLFHSRSGASRSYSTTWRAVAKALEIAGPCQMPPSAGSVMKTIRVGAVDCAGSQAGKQVCEREGAIERLPSVRLYADGARDTLAGP